MFLCPCTASFFPLSSELHIPETDDRTAFQMRDYSLCLHAYCNKKFSAYACIHIDIFLQLVYIIKSFYVDVAEETLKLQNLKQWVYFSITKT